MYNNAIFCSDKDSVPKVPHWAILEFSSVFIPGDERSRTHPGHGYPAHSEPTIKYRAYLNREDWVAEIELRMNDRSRSQDWIAISVQVPQISTMINVSC